MNIYRKCTFIEAKKIPEYFSHTLLSRFARCNGCGKKFNHNKRMNRHMKFVFGKPHQRNSLCNFSVWGTDHQSGDNPQYECEGGGGEEEGWSCPSPGRGQTSSTGSFGNLFVQF